MTTPFRSLEKQPSHRGISLNIRSYYLAFLDIVIFNISLFLDTDVFLASEEPRIL